MPHSAIAPLGRGSARSDGVPGLDAPRPAPPIFIVGVPRSGTTLLSAMLGAHPRLVCGPETHFFHQFGRRDPRAFGRRADWPKVAIDYLYSIEHVGESIP